MNEHGVGKLALNFVKRIRSVLNSGLAKQKLKEVHSKISSFWRSSDNPRSDKPETIYALSHNLNEETLKGKKDFAFSTAKDSMSMSIFSAKDNTNVEGKTENEGGIQDESQKCKYFIDSLFNIQRHHCNNIILAHILVYINSLRNKFDMLTNKIVDKKIDEWYIEWQRLTTNSTTSDNEWNKWQRVLQRITASDNDW